MIHIEGFEEFGNDPSPNAQLQRAQYGATGQWAIVVGRIGYSGLAGRNASLTRKFPWLNNTFSVGFAHLFDARGSVCWIKIGSVQVTLWCHPDTGLPYLNDKSGGALPTLSRWYYYELEINRSTGIVTLYINNRADMTYQMVGEITAGEIEVGLGYMAPAVYRPGVNPVPLDFATKTYDDVYMRDGARLQPIVVSTRFPTRDETTQWFRAASSGSHAESLSLRPPKPLDNYVAARLIGAEDAFTSSNPLSNDNPVIATGVVVLARKSPSLNAKLGVFVEGSGMSTREKVTTLDTEWKTQYLFFEGHGPDSAANVVASTFGITVSPP